MSKSWTKSGWKLFSIKEAFFNGIEENLATLLTLLSSRYILDEFCPQMIRRQVCMPPPWAQPSTSVSLYTVVPYTRIDSLTNSVFQRSHLRNISVVTVSCRLVVSASTTRCSTKTKKRRNQPCKWRLVEFFLDVLLVEASWPASLHSEDGIVWIF